MKTLVLILASLSFPAFALEEPVTYRCLEPMKFQDIAQKTKPKLKRSSVMEVTTGVGNPFRPQVQGILTTAVAGRFHEIRLNGLTIDRMEARTFNKTHRPKTDADKIVLQMNQEYNVLNYPADPNLGSFLKNGFSVFEPWQRKVLFIRSASNKEFTVCLPESAGSLYGRRDEIWGKINRWMTDWYLEKFIECGMLLGDSTPRTK